MKLVIIFVTSLLFCSLAQAFETGKDFIKINEEDNSLEVAFRSYQNSSGKIVRLLGMIHVAHESFFAQINDIISNQIVLYELAGQTWEELRLQKIIINSFGEGYYERCLMFDFNYWVAKQNGLSCQTECINYEVADKIIHADIQADTPVFSKIQLDLFTIQQYENSLEKDEIREADLKKMAEAIFKKKFNEIPTKKELAFKIIETQNMFDLIKEKTAVRNSIIKEKLIYFLPEHEEFHITYGAFHFGDLETFLLEQGFEPMKNGEKWIKAFSY